MTFKIPSGVDFFSHALHIPNLIAGARPVSALLGTVVTTTTIRITFSACVSIPAADASIQYRINGGTWTQCGTPTEISPNIWEFTTAIIDPGDVVDWQYTGETDAIVDCTPDANDIGPEQLLGLDNPLVLAGDFVLMESGGLDIALVEEDPDQTEGVQVEEAP